MIAGLQLALSFAFTADLVFCTAASGHVAVESAYGADCCDDHILPDSAGRRGGDEGCGCVDTPILQSPGEARQRSEYAPPSPQTRLLPAFLAPHRAGAVPTSGPILIRRSCAPGQAPPSRRSVVLLV